MLVTFGLPLIMANKPQEQDQDDDARQHRPGQAAIAPQWTGHVEPDHYGQFCRYGSRRAFPMASISTKSVTDIHCWMFTTSSLMRGTADGPPPYPTHPIFRKDQNNADRSCHPLLFASCMRHPIIARLLEFKGNARHGPGNDDQAGWSGGENHQRQGHPADDPVRLFRAFGAISRAA